MENEAELAELMEAQSDHPVTKVVRDLMSATSLTQEGLARKLGVSVSVVNQMNAGRSVNPSWETLAKLVTTFGVDPRLLFPDRLNGREAEE